MDADLRADDVEQPGHDVDLDVECPERADERERRLVRSSENATTTRSTSNIAHDVGEPVGRPEKRHVRELRAHLARVVVDETDDVDPVLGVLEELSRDELPDVTRAHDDRVLDVERLAGEASARRRGRR